MTEMRAIAQSQPVDTNNNQTVRNFTIGNSNTTASNFDGIIQDLITARQQLLHKNTELTFDALNSATSEIFKLIARQEESNIDAMDQKLRPIQTHLEEARHGLQNSNNTYAFQHMNAADFRLFKIIDELP